MYNIELNIAHITVELLHCMTRIAVDHGFEVIKHGWDHIVFKSDRGVEFTTMINELSNVCKIYGINYVDLLV